MGAPRRLIIDENVPDSVARFLSERGHDVQLVRERFGQMTPDEFISWIADIEGAIVVTADRDFRRIVSRVPRGAQTRFKKLGRISLRCRESRALSRVQLFIDEIEREFERSQAAKDSRVIVEITETTFVFVR